MESLPTTVAQLRTAVRNDLVLSKIGHFVTYGWPATLGAPAFRPFVSRQSELTVEDGCVMWGMRAVIPEKLRPKLLAELHREHMGISQMKSVASI